MRRRVGTALVVGLLLCGSASGAESPAPGSFDHAHARFERVLRAHVRQGQVDYAALQAERATLDGYLQELAALDAATLAGFSREQQLAFWINSYNALVLRTVVDRYPIKGRTLVGVAFPANSIWQVPGAFGERRHRVAGRLLSLDDIEHRTIRPQFREPRVHVALVCAARSCPPLRPEPYRAATLEAQLDDQARVFMADRIRGLRLSSVADALEVSTIFKWFGEDFAPLGGGDVQVGIRAFAARHAPAADAELSRRLAASRTKLRFLDYDWTLNDAPAAARATMAAPRS